MQQAHSAFEQLLAAYGAAVLAKDAAAFAALYSDDVHVFDIWERDSLRGIAAWRSMAEQWFQSLGEDRVQVSAQAIESCENAELAIGHALLTYTALSPTGETLRSLSNRISMGLRREQGQWKVFHEHSSLPGRQE
ncbi:YybH family protein [Chromobacterium haemolyticum]|uniref:SnoaL-like domain-containing protein n=1 Tax=Chromobacterium haemolyticum TaxID=394935 RepID=A0A1W0DBC3_9NEIS|nr:SgcJ/EcaC family oxidoreductase [Chromobacterium haemolyticum]OQS44248.1 hypothetical protein B0T45_01225 [Chromobacterium haemolyticum]